MNRFSLRLPSSAKGSLNGIFGVLSKRGFHNYSPYLILHKRSQILNMPNPIARLFDNIGFQCKIMCRFKISAKAGIQVEKTGFRIKSGMTKL